MRVNSLKQKNYRNPEYRGRADPVPHSLTPERRTKRGGDVYGPASDMEEYCNGSRDRSCRGGGQYQQIGESKPEQALQGRIKQ